MPLVWPGGVAARRRKLPVRKLNVTGFMMVSNKVTPLGNKVIFFLSNRLIRIRVQTKICGFPKSMKKMLISHKRTFSVIRVFKSYLLKNSHTHTHPHPHPHTQTHTHTHTHIYIYIYIYIKTGK